MRRSPKDGFSGSTDPWAHDQRPSTPFPLQLKLKPVQYQSGTRFALLKREQFLQSKTQGTQSTKQAAALLKPTKVNMKTLSTPLTKEEKHAHNEIAAVLSIMPGLGHIYKGHYEMGFLWMFLGMPVAIFVGIISILGTAGIGLLLPIGCWAALAYDAYNEKDRRHHHHLTWDGDDESPD